MKSAEQHQLFPLGFPHGGALSTRGAASMLQMAPNNRLANDRVPEKHQRHSLICKSLTASKRRISWVDASASDYNVAMTTSAKHIPAQFQRLQNVVIVGGGISGLATALALHRLGIKPLLLEQADHLRTAGATLLIWTNAWKALEALGVANRIRKTCDKLSGLEFFGEDGASFLSSGFDNVSRDFEVRGVERKTLLEILKESFPDGTAIYDSRVIGIKKLQRGYGLIKYQIAVLAPV
ncbi:hypothetical protein GOP47_0013370 [Adiantum capillus-veneris]|uniref:FAD-binding domain-containing protein n=1 Tax=Adiantum capillus-veneris TaxID=13818 RepID=A0A9D4UNE3_ADICA|nr:hypothetical protein GOP47_0013370 [Adiantum capillus-veneris]